jgi:YegS/Rv2252/BmrU family lipid kinase
MKLLFCVNPGAGRKRGRDWHTIIHDRFAGTSDNAVVLKLEKGNDLRRNIEEAIEQHDPDLVVAVGGDGTVNLVATIVGGTGMAMGIIPCGSANGMATDLGIPTDPEEALNILVEREARPMDAILINGELCLHLADLGLNARLIKLFEQTPARGMWVYARLSVKVLMRSERFKVSIRTEKEELRRSAFMVVLANARKYGTGATINKIGQLDDGLFEVVLVRRFGLRELWDSLIARRRFDPQRVELVQAREVEIRTERRSHFQIDGDHKGKVQQVRARIMPGHLRMVH